MKIHLQSTLSFPASFNKVLSESWIRPVITYTTNFLPQTPLYISILSFKQKKGKRVRNRMLLLKITTEQSDFNGCSGGFTCFFISLFTYVSNFIICQKMTKIHISSQKREGGTACNSMWAPKRCLYTESLSSVAIRHARGAHLGYIDRPVNGLFIRFCL